MLDHELIDCLVSSGPSPRLERLPGDRYAQPELDIVLYLKRAIRLGILPVLGQSLGVVCLAREPGDLDATTFTGTAQLLSRASRAISTRFPPVVSGHGLAILSCLIITTHRAIPPNTEEHLEKLLNVSPRSHRVVTLGLFLVNPEQEILAQAVRKGSGFDYPEPLQIAETLSARLRRYVPLMPPEDT